MSAEPTLVLVAHRALPGCLDRAVNELKALIATVIATEPECHGIRFYQDLADPTRILLLEEWSDQAAYLGPHMQTPHLTAFISRAAEFLVVPPEISFWRLGFEQWPGAGAA
jgi:quinol monooxygenase YgiN